MNPNYTQYTGPAVWCPVCDAYVLGAGAILEHADWCSVPQQHAEQAKLIKHITELEGLLDDCRHHLRGTADRFSARERTPLLSRIDALLDREQ